jgi:ABC-2 type transport system permease protein
MSEQTPAGVIHDIGYQRYAGPRLGRRYIVTSIYTHSLRTAFGLGRTGKAKIFPWLVAGSIGLSAVVLAVLRVQLSDTEEIGNAYTGFADTMSWLVIFAVAVAAPELVSRDLRSGVTALYFSRPLRSHDYVLAKLAGLASTVWLLLGAPQLIMFAVSGFSMEGGASKVWDEFTSMLGGTLYAAIWAAVFASVALLVASVTGRRAFAAGGVVAVFLVTTPVVGVLASLPSTTANHLAGLFSPTTLIQGLWRWLSGAGPDSGGLDVGDFGPWYAVTAAALVGACVVLLLLRYRKVAGR